jgi:hypothetical protein
MQSVFKADVVCLDPLDRLELVLVLADAPDCNSQTIDKEAVGKSNVGRVGFEGDAVVLADDSPVAECQVGRKKSVSPICVSYDMISIRTVSWTKGRSVPLDEPSRAVLLTKIFSNSVLWLWMIEKVLS